MKQRNLDRLADRVIRSADRAIRAIDQTLKTVARSESRMRTITLSTSAFKRFTAILDHPPANNPKLRRLLQTRAPWEK